MNNEEERDFGVNDICRSRKNGHIKFYISVCLCMFMKHWLTKLFAQFHTINKCKTSEHSFLNETTYSPKIFSFDLQYVSYEKTFI